MSLRKKITRFFHRLNEEHEYQKWVRRNKIHRLPNIKIIRMKGTPPWAR